MTIDIVQFLIKHGFDAVVFEATAGKAEQREFLLNHPKRALIELNILKEIRKAELNPRFKMTRPRIELIIKAGAQLFCQCAIAAKIKELMTEAELKRHIQKAGEMADTQQFMDDMAKEAASTAVTKGMFSGEPVGQEGRRDQDRLGSGEGNGPSASPDPGDFQGDGSQPDLSQ